MIITGCSFRGTIVLTGLICFWCYVFLFHREELVDQCIKKGTELVQAIAVSLFSSLSTEDVDGPLVKLPPPLTKLPKEKHVGSSL